MAHTKADQAEHTHTNAHARNGQIDTYTPNQKQLGACCWHAKEQDFAEKVWK